MVTITNTISKEEYGKLLSFMVDDDQLEIGEGKELLVGEEGQRDTGNFQFFAVFETELEFSVKYNSQEIGTLERVYPVGQRFALAGKTWQVLESVISTPYPNKGGLFEPGIFEHENGDLWLYCRTPFGHQYDTVSHDAGKSWIALEPNCRFTSPDSPMRVKRVKDFVVAVYNPVGYNCLQWASETWGSPKRTPIVLALSRNDGRSFNDRGAVAANGGFLDVAKSTYLLEDDLSNSYCYPSVLEVEDGLLVSYYHSDGDVRCLNASKVIKIYENELTEGV